MNRGMGGVSKQTALLTVAHLACSPSSSLLLCLLSVAAGSIYFQDWLSWEVGKFGSCLADQISAPVYDSKGLVCADFNKEAANTLIVATKTHPDVAEVQNGKTFWS